MSWELPITTLWHALGWWQRSAAGSPLWRYAPTWTPCPCRWGGQGRRKGQRADMQVARLSQRPLQLQVAVSLTLAWLPRPPPRVSMTTPAPGCLPF